jgi:hypothetical protein
MKKSVKLKMKKTTPVIIKPSLNNKAGNESQDTYVESHKIQHTALKHAEPPKKTGSPAKEKKSKTKKAHAPSKGLTKGKNKKRKFYTVTVKTKDKTTGKPKSQTMNVRAPSEVDAYKLVKRYYTNAKANKVRLDKKRNKALKEDNHRELVESLMKKLAIGVHDAIFKKSPLSKKIETYKERERASKIAASYSPKVGAPNNRDEEYDVHDSKGTHIGTHKNYNDAAAHAHKENGHLVVRKTHVTKYHIVHSVGGTTQIATHTTGKGKSKKTNAHTYDSIHKARAAMTKHGLDASKHRIVAQRTKVQ